MTGALSRVPGARIILPGSSRVSAASSLRSGQFWEPRRLNLKDIGVEASVAQSSSDPPRSHKVGDFFLPRPRLPHGGTDLLALVPRTPLPVHTRSWKWGRTSRRLLLQAPSLMAPADTKPRLGLLAVSARLCLTPWVCDLSNARSLQDSLCPVSLGTRVLGPAAHLLRPSCAPACTSTSCPLLPHVLSLLGPPDWCLPRSRRPHCPSTSATVRVECSRCAGLSVNGSSSVSSLHPNDSCR